MPIVQTNGIRMHYEVAGAGDPLLLLHGLGSRSEDWELQFPIFARHFQVITADMRGHGRSDRPAGPYQVAMMASDVAGLLDALAVDTAHVVGLSMGGMIAFQMAIDWPGRVRSLVIVNSAPALVPRTLTEWLRIRQRLLLARLFSPTRTGRFLSFRLFPKPDQAQIRAQLIERWATNDRRAYLASMRALIGWSVLDHIDEIHCPVLVIAGDRDYLPLDAKRAYIDRIMGARLVVFEDSGHATPIDQADRFNECVLDFLFGIERDRRDPVDRELGL